MKLTTLITLAALLGAASSASAAELNYNLVNGTNNWDLSTTNWNNGTGNVAWSNTSPVNDAKITSTFTSNRTVTIGADLVNVGTITVGTPSGQLSFGGTLSNLNFTTFNMAVTGGGKVRFVGTTATGGTINISGGNTLYASSGDNIRSTVNLSGTGNTENYGALRLDSGALISGNVNLTADATVGAYSSGTATISGAIGGSGKLTKTGATTLVLSHTNNYTGGTLLSAGAISVESASSLGSGAVTVAGGTLQVGASGLSGIASLSVNTGGINTSAGAISTTGVFTLSGGTWTLGNAIDGITAGSFALNSGQIDLSGFTNKSTAGTYSLISGTGTSSLTNANFLNGDSAFSYSVNSLGDLVVASAVPEPSTYGVMGAGALVAAAFVRRRRKSA